MGAKAIGHFKYLNYRKFVHKTNFYELQIFTFLLLACLYKEDFLETDIC